MSQKYVGNAELRNDTLEAVYHEGGRLVPRVGGFEHQYVLKDHLGNTRVMFADLDNNGSVAASEIVQQNHYYPFGLNHEGAWERNKNKYQYNGKENNQEFGISLYDYGARWYDAALARWGAVDPLAEKYYGFSVYNYVLGSPLALVDPDGKFPITPDFKKNYPKLTNFIETRLQNYIQSSPKMLATLNKYSTGNLTKKQIESDFKPNNGPLVTGYDFTANPNQSGEYDYGSNTIRLSNKDLTKFESILNDSNPEKQKWGEMDFTKLFLNEYTHYGDALDGLDAVLDESGNVVNSDIKEPGDFAYGVFDEGNATAGELFPFTGRQNYMLYKYGKYVSPTTNQVIEIDKAKIDITMIPPNKN